MRISDWSSDVCSSDLIMPLYLNDEQTMLRDTAKDFVAEHAPVSHMRSLRDANDATGFSRDLWKQFAEMGFTGILIGEEQGGLGPGHVEDGVGRSEDRRVGNEGVGSCSSRCEGSELNTKRKHN